MALKKPSDLFGNKSEDDNVAIIESDNTLREELIRVENLSEQVTKLQQELSQKVIKNDLESLVLSQINSMQENFEYLQNDFKKSNKKNIVEFKERVSELTEIVGNLVENELPKYKKQVAKNEVRIGDKFDELKEVVEENIVGIREEIDSKVNDIVEVIDNNLEYFNNQLQETSVEVKKTTDTYNKLSKIVECRVSKENDKLEEYSQVIKSLHEAFVELEESLQKETSTYNQIIEEKFETISSDVKNRIGSIDENVDNFKNQVSSDISSIKADVVINEQHIKNVDKYIQNHHQELKGTPNISIGVITATDYRIQSVAEKTTIVGLNTANLVYNTGGGNVAICTNPSGDITLNVTGIPTDSAFDNYSLAFSVIVTNTGTARSCTAINLNGLSRTIKWFGGSLSAAISGVTTSNGYDVYSFTGINTVGSASTTANYIVLGSVNGSYR